MRIVGGEPEMQADTLFLYITDSGRSSLRLILKSGLKPIIFRLHDKISDDCALQLESLYIISIGPSYLDMGPLTNLIFFAS